MKLNAPRGVSGPGNGFAAVGDCYPTSTYVMSDVMVDTAVAQLTSIMDKV